MEFIKAVLAFAIFIGVVALLLGALEKLSKKIGSKPIYITLIFVIPISLGASYVASNFHRLEWYEVFYMPFLGSALIIAAIFMALVSFNPEILCVPFYYIYRAVLTRRK
jgi:hypothetical protein